MKKSPSYGNDPMMATLRACMPAILIVAVSTVVISLIGFTPILYMMNVMARVVDTGSLPTLVSLTILAVGVLALGDFLHCVQSGIGNELGNWISRKLTLEAFPKMISAALRGGSPPNQVLSDISELRGFVSGPAVPTVFQLLWMPLALAFFMFLSHWLVVVYLIFITMLIVISILNEVSTHAPLVQAKDQATKGVNQVVGALRNAESIDAMGMGGRIAKRWFATNEAAIVDLGRANRWIGFYHSLGRFVQHISTILMLAVGALLVIEKQMPVYGLFPIYMVHNRSIGPIVKIVSMWRSYVDAWSSFQRLRAVFGEASVERGAMALPRPEGRLSVEGLVFIPPGRSAPVIKGISFAVEPGEIVAVVGASAAGKSTLARLLVGVQRPTSGAVRLDGHDVFVWERQSFGANVGYMPQSVQLFDGSVRENICRLMNDDGQGVIEAAKKTGIHELVGTLPYGYDTLIGDGNLLLTGGQRQRIALARAFYGNPRFLVLDEPDASLDRDGEDALIATLKAAKAAGTIVIVISHRPSLMALADKVLVLKEGRIASFGPSAGGLADDGARKKPNLIKQA